MLFAAERHGTTICDKSEAAFERLASGPRKVNERARQRLAWYGPIETRIRRAALESAGRAARAYASMSWARITLLTLFLTAGLYLLDTVTGNLAGFTILYILPIWLAARLSGFGSGLFAMLVVGTVLTLSDAGMDEGGHAALNFAIRWIGLGGFLVTVLQIESALRSARQLASHDPLTGLVNRFSIEALANESIENAKVGGRLQIAVIDCDNFKALNDANGHAFGDHALRVAARRLESVVKDKGKVGRLGGDEFVVLFEGIDAAEARQLLERANNGYRRILASLGCPASLSYGLAICGPDGTTFDALCRVADERMYARKRAAEGLGLVEMEVDETSAHVA